MSLQSDILKAFEDAAETEYVAVSPSGDENPNAMAWYDSDGAESVTTDTEVVSGKTYYEKVLVNDNPDEFIAQGVADAIASFVSGCTLTITPATLSGADTSPTGTFSGSATATWSITGDSIKSTLLDAFTSDMTDADFAQAFADALDADAPTFNITITGQTTPPSGTPTPSVDSGTATTAFVSTPVKTGLLTCCMSMGAMTTGGDQLLANTIATLVTTYYCTPGLITFTGATHLVAVAGGITVTPGG